MPKKYYNLKSNSGFTLVELLLYMALTVVILLVVSSFISIILQSRIKNQAISEVEQQGLQIVQQISQVIRNAEVINSPTPGNSSSNLSLTMDDVFLNPTVFSLLGNALQVSEGGGAYIDLTNSLVEVSNVSFYNLSQADTPGIIRIELTLNYYNPENRQEFNYEKTFYSSASLR